MTGLKQRKSRDKNYHADGTGINNPQQAPVLILNLSVRSVDCIRFEIPIILHL